MIKAKDVQVVTEQSDTFIQVHFKCQQKQRNEGFTYHIPTAFLPLFRKYLRQICPKAVEEGKLQFLKKWNHQGKRRIQNTGKHTISKLHGITCNILGKSSENYTSHTWRRSAATNLADAVVSLINLKRYGQWVSDSVVEGYIANWRPLRQEQLCCLLPEVERKKLEKREEVGQQQTDFILQNNLLRNDETSMVDLSNLPDQSQTDLTLIGFSQYYDPESDIEVPLLTGHKKQNIADVTPEKTEIVPKKEQLLIKYMLPNVST